MQGPALIPPQSRAERKRETRQRILKAAALVYARDGIVAATTVDIAAEAGVAHGSVFAHFGSQEALLEATIVEFGDGVCARLHELVEGGADTESVLRAHLEAIRESEGLYSRLVAEGPLLPRAGREALTLIQSSICFHLSPAVEADTEAGLLKPMPLHLLFNTWIGLVHYYLANRELFAPGASVVERRGKELLGHFMSVISIGGWCGEQSDANV
jgi:Transcriptional regulator